MSTLPERNVVSRRRLRRGAPGTVSGPAAAPPAEPFRWTPFVVLAAVLAIVTLAGVEVQALASPRPTGALSGCRLPQPSGLHTFVGRPAMCINTSKTYIATIQTTKGSFQVVMPAVNAPTTVNNFVVLATNGYYNGRRFFDVESWKLQTGDPNDNGSGGPGYTLPDEPNKQPFIQGAVGMARFPGGGISGSQFFIVKGAWPGNGPGSTVFNNFGTVLGGLELVNAIDSSDRVLNITITVQ